MSAPSIKVIKYYQKLYLSSLTVSFFVILCVTGRPSQSLARPCNMYVPPGCSINDELPITQQQKKKDEGKKKLFK